MSLEVWAGHSDWSQTHSLLNLKQTNLPNHLQIHHNYLQLDLFNLIQMDTNGRQINSKDRFTGLQVLLTIGVFGNHNSTNYFFSFDILHSYGQKKQSVSRNPPNLFMSDKLVAISCRPK